MILITLSSICLTDRASDDNVNACRMASRTRPGAYLGCSSLIAIIIDVQTSNVKRNRTLGQGPQMNQHFLSLPVLLNERERRDYYCGPCIACITSCARNLQGD